MENNGDGEITLNDNIYKSVEQTDIPLFDSDPDQTDVNIFTAIDKSINREDEEDDEEFFDVSDDINTSDDKKKCSLVERTEQSQCNILSQSKNQIVSDENSDVNDNNGWNEFSIKNNNLQDETSCIINLLNNVDNESNNECIGCPGKSTTDEENVSFISEEIHENDNAVNNDNKVHYSSTSNNEMDNDSNILILNINETISMNSNQGTNEKVSAETELIDCTKMLESHSEKSENTSLVVLNENISSEANIFDDVISVNDKNKTEENEVIENFSNTEWFMDSCDGKEVNEGKNDNHSEDRKIFDSAVCNNTTDSNSQSTDNGTCTNNIDTFYEKCANVETLLDDEVEKKNENTELIDYNEVSDSEKSIVTNIDDGESEKENLINESELDFDKNHTDLEINLEDDREKQNALNSICRVVLFKVDVNNFKLALSNNISVYNTRKTVPLKQESLDDDEKKKNYSSFRMVSKRKKYVYSSEESSSDERNRVFPKIKFTNKSSRRKSHKHESSKINLSEKKASSSSKESKSEKNSDLVSENQYERRESRSKNINVSGVSALTSTCDENILTNALIKKNVFRSKKLASSVNKTDDSRISSSDNEEDKFTKIKLRKRKTVSTEDEVILKKMKILSFKVENKNIKIRCPDILYKIPKIVLDRYDIKQTEELISENISEVSSSDDNVPLRNFKNESKKKPDEFRSTSRKMKKNMPAPNHQIDKDKINRNVSGSEEISVEGKIKSSRNKHGLRSLRAKKNCISSV